MLFYKINNPAATDECLNTQLCGRVRGRSGGARKEPLESLYGVSVLRSGTKDQEGMGASAAIARARDLSQPHSNPIDRFVGEIFGQDSAPTIIRRCPS